MEVRPHATRVSRVELALLTTGLGLVIDTTKIEDTPGATSAIETVSVEEAGSDVEYVLGLVPLT